MYKQTLVIELLIFLNKLAHKHTLWMKKCTNFQIKSQFMNKINSSAQQPLALAEISVYSFAVIVDFVGFF